ncbi:MAG: DUF1501 domain-containing protein, partial [Planctomycetota bacterium]|nr:DUF1501 domain-containing protein [Planctomycetota bacterium]
QGWMGALAARAAATPGPTKSCIFIWMAGGPSHTDTWDPKGSAPQGYRGPFETIKTNVPDIQFSSLLPNLAKSADRLTVVRSMTSPEVDHPLAWVHVHTGYRQGSGGVEHPAIGAVVAKRLGLADSALPNYIFFKNTENTFGTGSGILGPDFQPLFVAGNGVIANASAPLPPEQFASEVELLTHLNERYVASHEGQAASDQARTLTRSIRLMTSTKLSAFDIGKEPASVREAYGDSRIGHSCLRARRLVEVGVPFVEIYCDDWDTHGDVSRLLPASARPFDQAAAALIADLEKRGMLENTLIVMIGEFGRTPKLNPNSGRDHFSKAWSAALAGGGAPGGLVVGKTNADGSEITDRPVTVVQLLSTVYTLLGIDPEKPLPSPGGRPVPMIDSQKEDATPVREIVA